MCCVGEYAGCKVFCLRVASLQEPPFMSFVNNMGAHGNKVYPVGVVYGAMHCPSGKWYIGSSTKGLECRRYYHYAEAHDPTKKSVPKFHQALLGSEETDWIWGVHEEFQDISRADLLRAEGSYQRAFNSVADGFNSYHEDNTGKPVAVRKRDNQVIWNHNNLVRVSVPKKPQSEATEAKKEYHRQYYQANKEKWKVQGRKRQDDPVLKAKTAAYHRVYYQECKARATSTAAGNPGSA